MRPIINMPEEDQVMDTGNMHKKMQRIKDRTRGSGDILVDRQTDRQTQKDRQTDRQTDALITILHNCSRG